MNNKIIAGVVVVAVLVLGGVYVASWGSDKTEQVSVTPPASDLSPNNGQNGSASVKPSDAVNPPSEVPAMPPPSAAQGKTPPPVLAAPPTAVTPPAAPAGPKSYTASQVAEHKSESSCWTIVDGEVYDVSPFMAKHPGGKANILKLCGIDGTSLFEGKHGGQSKAEMKLESLKIGVLAK